MKKSALILVTTLIFTLLFYNESVGINLSIFGCILIGFVLYKFPEALKRTHFKIVLGSTVLLLLSNVWLFGPEMFLMCFVSLCLLRAFAQYPSFKLFIAPFVFLLQGLATFIRVFMPMQTLTFKSTTNKDTLFRNTVAYIALPFLFIIGFVFIYVLNSNILSSLFSNFKFTIDGTFFLIALLGFYLMFSFWDGWIYSSILFFVRKLNYNLSEKNTSIGFLPEDLELKSGQITLLFLNIILFVFVGIYVYEQLFLPTDFSNLSIHTHQRVNSLIISIVMAVVVLLYFFRDRINFTQKNQFIKKLAFVWMGLNALLIVITALKTIDYITHLGLTQMRLGVLWFLLLCVLGLIFTCIKIVKVKTSFYLIDKMSWAVYLGLIVVVVPNWSSFITSYNLQKTNTDLTYLSSYSLSYNQKQLLNYYKNNPENFEYKMAYNKVLEKQQLNFLSKELYYESINLNQYPKPIPTVYSDKVIPDFAD